MTSAFGERQISQKAWISGLFEAFKLHIFVFCSLSTGGPSVAELELREHLMRMLEQIPGSCG